MAQYISFKNSLSVSSCLDADIPLIFGEVGLGESWFQLPGLLKAEGGCPYSLQTILEMSVQIQVQLEYLSGWYCNSLWLSFTTSCTSRRTSTLISQRSRRKKKRKMKRRNEQIDFCLFSSSFRQSDLITSLI